MIDGRNQDDKMNLVAGVAETERKPYVPPAIEEEAMIENLAMACTLTKDCGGVQSG